MPDRGRRFSVIAAKKWQKPGRSLRIIFSENDFAALMSAFSAQETQGFEGYAVAQCGTRAGADKKSATCMVRSLHIPGEGDLINHSSVSVTPSADFMEAVLAGAMERRGSVLEIHTHPGSSAPSFSAVDVDHGMDNGRFLKSCRTGFSMMVLGSEGFAVMEYNGETDSLQSPQLAIISIMSRTGLLDLFSPEKTTDDAQLPLTVDRQVRIWGGECQRKINALTAGIVGLGGTGSVLLQMLARLGVSRFVLCDPDVVEMPNLNRLPYAFAGDVGKKKARTAAGYVKKISRDAAVKAIVDPVQDAKEAFRGCDVLFGCADNDGARLTLNEISLKYFIPYIDTGTEIFMEGGKVRDIGGQVRIVVPGVTGCLECAGAIDHEEAAASLLSADEMSARNAAGYIRGTGFTPAPAVITLNTVIASMAVQELVDMMARRERDSLHNYYLYDATVPRIKICSFERNPDCPMCGRDGILGSGDLRKYAASKVRVMASPGTKSL